MHPALYSWREQLPATIVRMLAYLGGIAVLSIAAAQIFQSRPAMDACALDRLTLLSAGSEPKVGALFAEAELHRSFCGEHDPIIAATPKYKLLWKALATRPEPRRIGR